MARLRLLYLIVALVVILAISVGGVRALRGTARKPLAALFSEVALADGLKQPCWHGVCPGQQTIDQAQAILDADPSLTANSLGGVSPPYELRCWETQPVANRYSVCVQAENGLVKEISLESFGVDDSISPETESVNLRLGDLVTMWGSPIIIYRPFCGISNTVFSNLVAASFVWSLRSYHNPMETLQIDPALTRLIDIRIPVVTLSDMNVDGLDPDSWRWRGFGTYRDEMACGE